MLTDLVHKAELDPDVYSEKIIEIFSLKSSKDREKYCIELAEKGFDISNTLENLERYYMGEPYEKSY